MTVYQLDQTDFYIGFAELTEENKGTLNYTTKQMTIGYYKPRFNHDEQKWVEGATQEEIDQIKAEEEANRPPTPPDKNTIRLDQIEEAVGVLATQVAKNTLLQNQGGI